MSVSRTRPVMKVTRILDVRNRNLTAAALSLPRTITSHSSSSSFRQSTCIPFHPKLTVALSYNGAPTLLRDVASPYGNSRSRTFSSCKTLPTVKKISLLYPSVEVSIQRRFKKKSATKPAEVQEDLEEDEETDVVEEGNSGEPKEWKDLKVNVHSPRVDALLKGALSSSRTKVEEWFYEGRLRLNGEKVTKKSLEASAGDEIDVVMGNNVTNPDFLDVQRVVVDDIGTAIAKGKIAVTARVWKSLVVENYGAPNKFTLTGQ